MTPPDPARAKDGAASGEARDLMSRIRLSAFELGRCSCGMEDAALCPKCSGVNLALAVDALCASRVAEAVRAETERCLRVVDDVHLGGSIGPLMDAGFNCAREAIAARIRARGGGSGNQP